MELPVRKKIRLTQYDYSSPNAYFITVCTDKRRNLFWDGVGAISDRPENVALSPLGKRVDSAIRGISEHYPMISVDRYAIMPNHVHLLLQIHSGTGGRSVIAPTIGAVVRQMKSVVSKQAGASVWQKGFYDHVIRGEADYRDVWEYIENNPAKWMEDQLCGDGI